MTYKGYVFPEVNFLEPISRLQGQLSYREDLYTLEDYQNHFAMLKRIPMVLKGIEEQLSFGLQEGMTFPKEALKGVVYLLENVPRIEADGVQGSFYFPFGSMPADLADKYTLDHLRYEANQVINSEVIPAFKDLTDFLKNTYMKHLRPHEGVWSMTNGEAYYAKVLEYYTSVKGITPQEVHQIGYDSIADSMEQVSELAVQLGLPANTTFRELVQFARSRPDQMFRSKMEFFDFVRDLFIQKVNPRMQEMFPEKYLTEAVLNITVKEASGKGGLPVYYSKESVNGSVNGVFKIKLDNMSAYKKFEIPTIALHEGNPGHNFQFNALSFFNFPDFMGTVLGTSHTIAPSKFPRYTAHVEGWGLYSEYLGNEMGIYNDPLVRLGYLSGDLLRSCRLVVDTGIHAFRWDREKAIQFLMNHTAYTRGRVEAEVDRYITLPGQSTAYKIGERKIQAARKHWQKKLGQHFDIKIFHENILACYGPMDETLDDCMKLMYNL